MGQYYECSLPDELAELCFSDKDKICFAYKFNNVELSQNELSATSDKVSPSVVNGGGNGDASSGKNANGDENINSNENVKVVSIPVFLGMNGDFAKGEISLILNAGNSGSIYGAGGKSSKETEKDEAGQSWRLNGLIIKNIKTST